MARNKGQVRVITAEAVPEIIDSLPGKVSTPIKVLMEHDGVDAQVLHASLQVALMNGTESHLLGTIIAIQARKEQYPMVIDTIAMAAKLGRKVDPLWSSKRWKSEHDSLSRLETLERLSEANETYDLALFEALLPASWPGYLVKTSRRLGMEGLRQRHCVASWHAKIRTGTTAIAVVFVDKVRWTVELFNMRGRLALGQVKGRFNATPDEDTIKAIKSMLDIKKSDGDSNAITEFGSPREEVYGEFHRLMGVLRENGVREVAIHFSGGGDSGCINTITPDNDAVLSEIPTEVYKPGGYTFDLTLGRIPQPARRVRGDLEEAIESVVGTYLDLTGVDWYNNDGGCGEVIINVVDETVHAEIEVYYSESEIALDQTFSPLEMMAEE